MLIRVISLIILCVQVDTSSTLLATTRHQQVGKHGDIDVRLRSIRTHTREMIMCFKKMSVINDSTASDSIGIVPSTLMQGMTLERFASLHLSQKYFITTLH